MEFFEAVTKRHSYRGEFKDKPIPREDLEKIIHAGLLAPSGCNKQTTSFIIVDDKSLIEKIRAVHEMPAVQTATAIIICLTNKDPNPVFADMSFEVEDCAAAVENILLAVASLGYATVWIDGALRAEGRAEKIAEILGIPETKSVRIMLPLGHPIKEKSQPPKEDFSKRACWNKYSL